MVKCQRPAEECTQNLGYTFHYRHTYIIIFFLIIVLALIGHPSNLEINRLIRLVVSGIFLFCFHTLLRLGVFLHFSLISWKPAIKWTPSKVHFQQVSNCSKSAVNTRKRCKIYSYLTIKSPKRRHWHDLKLPKYQREKK